MSALIAATAIALAPQGVDLRITAGRAIMPIQSPRSERVVESKVDGANLLSLQAPVQMRGQKGGLGVAKLGDSRSLGVIVVPAGDMSATVAIFMGNARLAGDGINAFDVQGKVPAGLDKLKDDAEEAGKAAAEKAAKAAGIQKDQAAKLAAKVGQSSDNIAVALSAKDADAKQNVVIYRVDLTRPLESQMTRGQRATLTGRIFL